MREPARPVTATENRPFTLREALQFFRAERQFYARFLSGMALVTDKILHDPKLVGVALVCVCAGAAQHATVTLRQ